MLITLQSYNRLIPKNCENRHFDVEAEVVPFCPMSHRWDKWDKVGQVGQVGQSGTKWDKVGQVGQVGQMGQNGHCRRWATFWGHYGAYVDIYCYL